MHCGEADYTEVLLLPSQLGMMRLSDEVLCTL
jgi:hypothetical protein